MSCFLPLSFSQGYRKVKLCCEDVQGTSVLTNFHGMDLTRDKLCSLIKKWQTLIEGQVDVRTTDGYLLRIVSIQVQTKTYGLAFFVLEEGSRNGSLQSSWLAQG